MRQALQCVVFAFLLAKACAILSSISPPNGPCSGAVSISIFGSDFRTQDLSVGIKIATVSPSDGTACERSFWISETTLICKIMKSAAFGETFLVLTLQQQKMVLTKAWSYDRAVVSSVGGASNGPSSGSIFATFTGLSFGSTDSSGRMRVGCG